MIGKVFVGMKNSMIKTSGLRIKTIGISLSLAAAVIAFIVSNSTPAGMYLYMPLLPLVFAIVNIVFLKIYNKITVVTIIVILMEFIRYVVTPLIVMIEGYPKGLYVYSFSKEAMVNTVIIMVMEIIVIYYVLYACRNFSDISIDDNLYIKKILQKKNYSSIKITSVLIIAFTVILFLAFPGVKSIYSFIFSNDMDTLVYRTSSALDSLPRGVGWLANVFGETTRYIVIQNIIIMMFRKSCISQKNRYFYLSAIIIVLNMMVGTSSMVIGLTASIVLLFQLYILYPKERKLFLVVGITIGSIASIALVFNYLQNVLTYQSFSQMIQDYTNGYYNIYQAQFAYEASNLSLFEKLEMLFIGDGIANISPLNILFDTVNSSDIFNYYLYGTTFNGGAVAPYVSQWVYYFSPVIGPLFSAIPIYFSKKMESKWRNGEGNILVMGMLALVLALTPFMYNYPTLIHILTLYIMPLWLASKANEKFVFGTKL